jgi:hypothetical protein
MTQRVMSFKNKSMYVFIAVASLALIVLDEQQAFASQMAHDIGYQAGRSDRLNNEPYNDECDPNNSSSNPDLYCAAYIVGYSAGWNAAGLLYGDRQGNNNNNDNNNDDGN